VKVAAHAIGDDAIQACIRAGIDCIEHGFLASDETLRMMVEHGTFLVSTTALTDFLDVSQQAPEKRAKAATVFPQAKAMLTKAIDAGVRIACGSDLPCFPHGENWRELVAMVETYDMYKGAAPGNAGWAVERQNFAWVIPFHDGAIRLWKELGQWKPEHQAHNDKLLQRQNVLTTAWAEQKKGSYADDKAFVEAWQKRRAAARVILPLPAATSSTNCPACRSMASHSCSPLSCRVTPMRP